MFKLFRRWKYKKMLKYFQNNKDDFFNRKYGGICLYIKYIFPYIDSNHYKEIWNNKPEHSDGWWFDNDDERIAYIEKAIKLTYGT